MKKLIFNNSQYSFYEITADHTNNLDHDYIEISNDCSVWIELHLDYTDNLSSKTGYPRLLVKGVYAKFNNRASNNYNIPDAKQIAEEWSIAIEFMERVQKYLNQNDWRE